MRWGEGSANSNLVDGGQTSTKALAVVDAEGAETHKVDVEMCRAMQVIASSPRYPKCPP
jgi:hypothetical protein